jgi:hypothetical protein
MIDTNFCLSSIVALQATGGALALIGSSGVLIGLAALQFIVLAVIGAQLLRATMVAIAGPDGSLFRAIALGRQ